MYKGKVHRFADDVNTDEIIPARYLNTTDRAELARHCMEDADKSFAKRVKPGDIIVAGKNFGGGLPSQIGQKTPVVADEHAAFFFAAARDRVG